MYEAFLEKCQIEQSRAKEICIEAIIQLTAVSRAYRCKGEYHLFYQLYPSQT
jgi:hypothetical protein